MGVFKAQGQILKFDGYLRVLPGRKQEDRLLPPLAEGQAQDRLDLTAQPALHRAAAALQRGVAGQGAGKGRHRPAEHLCVDHLDHPEPRLRRAEGPPLLRHRDRHDRDRPAGPALPERDGPEVHRHFEEELDEIASGKMGYAAVLDEFWGPFSQALETAKTEMGALKGQETGEKCPSAASRWSQQFSRKTGGSFVGCSGFGTNRRASTSSRARANRNGPSRSRPNTSARPAASR